MIIDILTLFPASIEASLGVSIIGRARERGFVTINCHQIRDFTQNKQKQVDDYPYGGGMGMVMMAQPLYDCWAYVCGQAGRRLHTVYLSPQGPVFTQGKAKSLYAEHERFVLICGHYEGVDERFVEECVDEELSIGDYVITGGEPAAIVVADAVCRIAPGVLSSPLCIADESHMTGLLEYPHYTRPETWRGRTVPPVLLSGHHKNIDDWRREQSLQRTREKRPDMLEG